MENGMASTNVCYNDCYFVFQLALFLTIFFFSLTEMTFHPSILDGHICHHGFSDYKSPHALLP